MEQVSRAMETAEEQLAREIGAIHVPVSETLRLPRAHSPALEWFHSDGMHPGPDLTLLNAALLHRAIFRSLPKPDVVPVRGALFEPDARFDGSLPASTQHADAAANSHVYAATRVAAIIALAHAPTAE